MRLVCSYCWRIKADDGFPIGPVVEFDEKDSHDLCTECRERHFSDMPVSRPRMVLKHSYGVKR